MLSEGPSAFEHDVSRIECFVKESGDAALESHGCAEVTRAIPDEPAVVAIDGEASAYADVDSEQGRQDQRRCRCAPTAYASRIHSTNVASTSLGFARRK